MWKYLLLSLLFVVPSLCFSQGRVGYAYDAAGNRISRTIVLNMNAAKKQAITDKKVKMYSDMLAKHDIRISPNPTKGMVRVTITGLKSDDDCSLAVYSSAGQLIERKPVHGDTAVADISSQPNGYYLLHILVNGEKTVWKIIKN